MGLPVEGKDGQPNAGEPSGLHPLRLQAPASKVCQGHWQTMTRMTIYVLEPRCLEHLCQCCGVVTESLFCEDCSHETKDGRSGHQKG